MSLLQLSEREQVLLQAALPLSICAALCFIGRILLIKCCLKPSKPNKSKRKVRPCAIVVSKILDVLVVIAVGLLFIALPALDFLSWQWAGILILVFSTLYMICTSDFISNFRKACCTKQKRSGVEWYDMALAAVHVEMDSFDEVDLLTSHANAPMKPYRKKLLKQCLTQVIPLILYCGLMFFGAWAISATCLAQYPLDLSNHLTRSLSPGPCEQAGGKICHLYLTLTEDPSTSMVVTFHSLTQYSEAQVVYGENVSFGNVKTVKPVELRIKHPEGERYVYHALLIDLQPNSVVHFVVRNGEETLSQERKFRTFPVQSVNTSINFIVGGDFSMFDEGWNLVNESISWEPLFLAAGGDIAYDNACLGCYRRWDEWLLAWQARMTTPSGFTVPLLTAAGNHDAGGYWRAYSEAPYFTKYFVHGKFDDKFEKQTTYHYHKIANIDMFVLDSDHIESVSVGTQLTWLKDKISHSNSTWRMALYHVPIFPAYQTGVVEEELKRSLVPVFDNYNLNVAFENHGHYYKRTHLLRGGKVSENGTLYIGDGCFGVMPSQHLANAKNELFANFQITRFYLHVQVSSEAIKIDAVGNGGEKLDTVTIGQI